TEPDVSVFRPDRPGIRKVLGDLETEIMELVWKRPAGEGTTVRDVLEALSQRRHIAYTTVMTTMVRLARKNLLRVKKQGAAYVYSPALTQDEFVSRVAGRILEDLLVGFTGETIAKLKSLADPRVAARARHLLDEIARRRRVEEDE
ncbi:MAG: BlaI/MecI/CopY family transcriptional regulator, partial [Armatimonadota bacterium]